MLELTGWGDILGGVVVLYWLLAIYLFRQSVRKSTTRPGKIVSGIVVALLFGFFPLKSCVDEALYVRDHKARLAKAEAIFNERCKTAGERIYKAVDDVEGLLLIKVRGGNPGAPDAEDPFGSMGNPRKEDYIASFLAGYQEDGQLAVGWAKSLNESVKPGYSYVEAVDPKDGRRYRYTGAIKVVATQDVNDPRVQENLKRNPNYDLNSYRFIVDKAPASGPVPRYGVIFDDLTTVDERGQWIAGSAFRVINVETKEVLGERIGYFMDRGLGSMAGARTPWLEARDWSCPKFANDGLYRSDWDRKFTEQVLKIKGE